MRCGDGWSRDEVVRGGGGKVVVRGGGGEVVVREGGGEVVGSVVMVGVETRADMSMVTIRTGEKV